MTNYFLRSTVFHIVITLFFLPILSFAQKSYILNLSAINDDANVFKKVNYKEKQLDSLSALLEINKVISALHEKSYLMASVDSIDYGEFACKAKINVGHSFEWVELSRGNLSNDLIRQVDFKEKLFRGEKFNYKEFVALENRILRMAENRGYPFASISLDSLKVTEKSLSAAFHFEPGIEIVFDSIGVVGDAQISRKFLSNYLQIKNGELYNQSRVDKSGQLLQRLNIATIKKPPEIRFINGKAYTYLFLDAKRTTSIDGIAGLQQDKIDPERLLVTGEFNLNLRNILQSGKQAEIHWKKLNRGTSSLEAGYIQPALFGSPLELNGSFNFLDQDSTFIKINPKVGFKYNFLKWGALGFFFESVDTRLQDTSIFRGANTLPTFSDSRLRSYGLSYDWNNLDDFFVPRKGLKIQIEGSVGNKVLDKVLAEELYDGVDLKTLQIQGKGEVENHIQLKKNFTFVQRLSGAWTINDRLFFNDLYRLGGINSIRGFREYSFFASKYAIETLEFRIFTEETSYFMVFADYGQYVTEVEGAFERNFPLGFGGGLSFTTRAGIFNMVYALGKESGQAINFNNSVVNFGLVSRF